jgi:hypothetical protein
VDAGVRQINPGTIAAVGLSSSAGSMARIVALVIAAYAIRAVVGVAAKLYTTRLDF